MDQQYQSQADFLLQWKYTQALEYVLNMPMHYIYGAALPLSYPQPNMPYFMRAPNESTFQLPKPYLPYSSPGDDVKQLYNHAQSAIKYASQLGGSMQEEYAMGHRQPMMPIQYQSGPMQTPYYGYPPQNMSNVGQAEMENPYRPGTPAHNLLSPTSHLNNNVYNSKHIYVDGTLYNTELLDSLEGSKPSLQNLSSDEEFIEDEGYNPMGGDLPLIYGIRFYNPNYGPEGAIPPRPENQKKDYSKNELTSYLLDFINCHRLKYTRPDACTANCTQNEEPNKASHDQPKQKANEKILDDRQNLSVPMSPNLKTKRRQGRGRARGFTQSFGIVAPIKRTANTDQKNVMAAENVLSLFEKKPESKKLNNIESDKLNIPYVNWSLPTSKKMLTAHNNNKCSNVTASNNFMYKNTLNK